MNKAILIAAIALCCVVAVTAQHPHHCVAPAEFEAHFVQWDMKEQYALRAHFAYDSRLERTATVEAFDNSTAESYYHVINLHREHRRYIINLKDKTCTTQQLDYPFRRIEIPRDAHFIGEFIIGTNAFDNAGLLTTQWHHENKDKKWSWEGAFSPADKGCVPLGDHYHDETVGSVNSRFFDVVLGVGDPDVFVQPSICTK